MTQDKDLELIERILSLKQKRNAVLLVHNYQRPEVQAIADFLGDSLELSQKAADTEADVIVFCGVHFMAETASIINPGKVVLLPDAHAGCRMADMITAEALKKKKKELPDAKVVCYVNSTAEVKAESDICCTSANAVRIVQSLGEAEVIFVPDQYLGYYVATKLKRQMILWPGYCPTHVKIQPEDILREKQKHPGSIALAHPECTPEVTNVADEVLSTGGMIKFAKQTEVNTLIIGTEIGIIHRLKKENPGKTFIPATREAICPNMKKITLEKVLWALEDMQPQVKVPEDIRLRAYGAVQRMLGI
ncbi:MAG: quinolinate synthase NadA [Chloroflexi bacterium]|nr:quinolinate synthase NadA [Chloroflexota bacterium]